MSANHFFISAPTFLSKDRLTAFYFLYEPIIHT